MNLFTHLLSALLAFITVSYYESFPRICNRLTVVFQCDVLLLTVCFVLAIIHTLITNGDFASASYL